MQGILNLVWDHLLPAMKSDALPVDEAALYALNERLENLALAPVIGEATSTLAKEVSGKKFIMESNNLGVEALAFDLNENEKQLTLWNEEGEQKLPIGFNTLHKGKMSFPNQADWATASSGAWTSDNSYRIKIYNYESPHALTFDFKFKRLPSL